MPIADVLLLAAYLLAPGREWGFFENFSLSPATALALIVLLFLRPNITRWGRRIVFCALLLKVSSLVWIPTKGFEAQYFTNDSFSGKAERSLDFRFAPYTRIDRRLSFKDSEFPTYFYNDVSRFNYYGDNSPQQDLLPLSAQWTGYLKSEGPETIYLKLTPGSLAWVSLSVDGVPVFSTGESTTRLLPLASGWHSIQVTFSKPYGQKVDFSAGRIVGGQEMPFSEGVWINPFKVPSFILSVVHGFSFAFDLLLALGLAACLVVWLSAKVRARAYLTVISFVGAVALWVRALPAYHLPLRLPGGSDWLYYASYAREIALNGVLATFGQPLGEGRAFFNQPLYSYLLSVLHLLFGEEFFSIYLVQEMLLWSLPLLIFHLVRRSWDLQTAWIAFGVGLFTVRELIVLNVPAVRANETLLTESFFLPLSFITTIVAAGLLRPLADKPSIRQLLLLGFLGALTVLTRSTFMPSLLIFIYAIKVRFQYPWKAFAKCAAVPLGVVVFAMSLCTVRNYVVAHQWVVTNTYGPINFYVAHEPPGHIDLSQVEKRPIYKTLKVNPLVARVAESFIQDPKHFFRNIRRRGLLNLPITHRPRHEGVIFVIIWGLGMLSLFRAFIPKRLSFSYRFSADQLLPLWVSLTHFVILLFFSTHSYGNRMLYIVYLPLIPYAAMTLSDFWLVTRRWWSSPPVSLSSGVRELRGQ